MMERCSLPRVFGSATDDARMTSMPILEVRGLTKVYPGVTALDDVDLSVRSGEVRALLGENGAGKSTLIKMIGGLEEPTAGEIFVDGSPVRFTSSVDSQAVGISVVSQEFRLVPQMTVAENIFVGQEISRFGLISRRDQNERSRELLAQLDLTINPSRRIDSLTVADQQLVEISRALSRDFSILVLDEPTAALNESEVNKLLSLIEKLRERGTAILYVSHRLPEVLRIADVVTVLRDGRLVADMEMEGIDEDRLVELVLGKALKAETKLVRGANRKASGAVVLSVDGLRTKGVNAPVSIEVHEGEIVGVAGLVGSGRTELLKSLFGAQRMTAGVVKVDGVRVAVSSPADAVGAGIFMLSEDRKAEGIIPHLTVLENSVISARNGAAGAPRGWFIGHQQERATFGQLKERLRIRVDRPDRMIGSLSGGNQQKVLFSRATLTDCRVLLLNEPTRGIDVGARVEIYQLIRKLAAGGVAVVVSSSDAAEIAAVADNCIVMYAGYSHQTLRGDQTTEDNIVAASLGQQIEG